MIVIDGQEASLYIIYEKSIENLTYALAKLM